MFLPILFILRDASFESYSEKCVLFNLIYTHEARFPAYRYPLAVATSPKSRTRGHGFCLQSRVASKLVESTLFSDAIENHIFRFGRGFIIHPEYVCLFVFLCLFIVCCDLLILEAVV